MSIGNDISDRLNHACESAAFRPTPHAILSRGNRLLSHHGRRLIPARHPAAIVVRLAAQRIGEHFKIFRSNLNY
jgi:hypothetical protein